jgi:hypothetical protein
MTTVFATFFLRAAVPLVLLYLFETIIELHRQTVRVWAEKWGSISSNDGDICTCLEEIEENVKLRRSTEAEWFVKFFLLCFAPVIVTGLLAYSLITAPKDVDFGWLEFGFAAYFMRLFWRVTNVACHLSSDGVNARRGMMTRLAQGKMNFHVTGSLQAEAIIQTLAMTYKGFTILGFEMTPALRMRVLQTGVAIMGSLLMRATQSVLDREYNSTAHADANSTHCAC